MPNQIRLTVRGPRGGPGQGSEECDVLVSAPPGTVLAAVTGGLAAELAAAASARGGSAAPSREGESAAVYVGALRLDAARHLLGEPPLLDGAVVCLHRPAEELAALPAGGPRLHVVAGPDAGGVHLLHGGHVRVGRSADADVVLDDPDVSRLHCVVTVTESGAVTVADLGSTNGTTAEGAPVGERPVPLRPGASLRVGESVLRLRTDPVRVAPEPPGSAAPTPPVPAPGANASGAPRAFVPEQTGPGRTTAPGGAVTHGAGLGVPLLPPQAPPGARPAPTDAAGLPEPPVRTPAPGGHAPQPPPGESPAGAAPPPPQVPAGPSDADGRGARSRGSWARRWSGKRTASGDHPWASAPGPQPAPGPLPAPDRGRWPDPAEILLTALGPGPRLWERGPGHEDALTVRLGTAHHGARPGPPLTLSLREAGSLGLAGPRARLLPLARSVLAQLATLHGPGSLEIVVLASGRGAHRTRDWSWLGWLPHLRPTRGQDCRLLFAFDRDQAAARTAELTRRLDDGPLGPDWADADRVDVLTAASRHTGPATILVVDGDPGSAALRESVARLTACGAAAGVHVLCLAETAAATPSSPQAETLAAAYRLLPAFRECGAVALLSGAVATALRLVRRGGADRVGEPATVDGVSAAWAERVARALAPLREADAQLAPPGTGVPAPRHAAPLPDTSRLLEELGLARATPAALLARWPEPHQPPRACLVLGAGPRGPLEADLVAARSHLLVSGAPGSGKTELLCSLAASLAAQERPDRLALVLLDGGTAQGLRAATELPHATTYLAAGDPQRMRACAQALTGELKRRAELLDGVAFEEFTGVAGPALGTVTTGAAGEPAGWGEEDRGTLRLRPRPGWESRSPLPRLAVLVDDVDALVDPALGNPGRPAAGSVVRALEAVARDGLRLGVHLIAATGRPDRTAHTVTDQGASLRVALGGPASAKTPAGRGVLHRPDGVAVPFQAGRVTARIPRTATQRPTVTALDWARAGAPPTRRPVRELGNGPTDLALLASATDRAARECASPVPPPLV
ncbi:FHA domain-containing protein [Streptomyces sp. JJ66]|uniref:FtsK/SpoIIIE domain-containing protein n=1 Tax=Streptomyces sp. JJ66 TaxID=2803843 RepID=UPI001C59C735|nr:FtsK/SpoIIIE domain-containing protein [Streptomyces sp. JJ66]MBW1603245.1 FHA domain-containing protein [Streptomyces sp. JJ66]